MWPNSACRADMPLAGGELEPARRLAGVLVAALPLQEHGRQRVLRVGVAEIGSRIGEEATRAAGIGGTEPGMPLW